MREFIAKHRDKISGLLSGFDRLVFRGTLRSISFPDGMRHYLHANDVLLKDFGSHVDRVSKQLKDASLSKAQALGRPTQYLASSQVSKEEIAREVMARDGIAEGLVCVLTSVEPCWSLRFTGTGRPRSWSWSRDRGSAYSSISTGCIRSSAS